MGGWLGGGWLWGGRIGADAKSDIYECGTYFINYCNFCIREELGGGRGWSVEAVARCGLMKSNSWNEGVYVYATAITTPDDVLPRTIEGWWLFDPTPIVASLPIQIYKTPTHMLKINPKKNCPHFNLYTQYIVNNISVEKYNRWSQPVQNIQICNTNLIVHFCKTEKNIPPCSLKIL